MKEILEMLEEPDEDDVEKELDAIYIEPPDCNAGSDGDSGDESRGTVNNLSGRHLQAGASTVFKSGKRIDDKSLEPTSNSQKNVASSSKSTSKGKKEAHWVQGDLQSSKPIFPTAYYRNIAAKKPFPVFEMFFDDVLLSLIKSEISKYALF